MLPRPIVLLGVTFALCVVGSWPAAAATADKSDQKASKKADADKPSGNVQALIKDLQLGGASKKVTAAQELGNLGDEAKPAAAALCKATLDPAPNVVEAASEALEKVDPDLQKPVIALLKDKSPQNQAKALVDLAALKDGGSAAPVVAWFAQHNLTSKHGNRQIVPEAITCLGKLSSGDASTLRTLSSYTRQTNQGAPDIGIRRAAVEALGKIGAAHEETAKQVVPILLTAADTSRARGVLPGALTPIRIAALDALGGLGSSAKGAAPVLRRLKLDPDATVRQAATNALTKVEE